MNDGYRGRAALPSAIWQDLRFGVRMLCRRPGLTVLIVGTLALGVGAGSTLLSVFRAVGSRALPYPEPDRLVALWDFLPGIGVDRLCVTYLNFMDWRSQNQVFEGMAAFQVSNFNLSRQGGNEPERVTVSMVSSDYFSLLGAKPALGRLFAESEFQPGGGQSVILSHEFWRSRFGGRDDVLGKSITLDNRSFTVVGILPAEFTFAFRFALDQINRNPDIWAPLFSGLAQADDTANRYNHVLGAIARLKAGTTIEQAQANMDVIARRLARQYPNENTGLDHVRVMPLQESMYGNLRSILWSWLAVVIAVLLLIGFNVAHLQLSRGLEREKELAIRASLGASRGRIIRQLLVESTLVALVSCGIGIGLSRGGCGLVNSFLASTYSPIPLLCLDAGVLAVVVLVALAVGLLFGAAPALYLSRPALDRALKEGGRQGTRGPASQRLSRMLVTAELSLSVAIMLGAGLLLKSFAHLWRQDPGFRADNALSMEIPLSVRQYPDGSARVLFYRRLLERVQALPGVAGAGLTSHLPSVGANLSAAFIEGRPADNIGQANPFNVLFVSPEYRDVLGIPLQQGRFVTDQDADSSPAVAVISESAARQYWGNQDPLGARIRRGDWEAWRTIVGVVGDVKQDGLAGPSRPALYIPFTQIPHSAMTLVVRAEVSSAALVPAIRKAVQALDPNQPIARLQTLGQALERNLAERRFMLQLVGVFAAGAGLLAIGGLYSVLAFSVRRRTREFGIRIALGARAADVIALVLRQGVGMVVIGSLAGLGLGLASARLLTSFLYGVAATDPVVFVGVVLLVDSVALLACYLPARRATQVDPIAALRCE